MKSERGSASVWGALVVMALTAGAWWYVAHRTQGAIDTKASSPATVSYAATMRGIVARWEKELADPTQSEAGAKTVRIQKLIRETNAVPQPMIAPRVASCLSNAMADHVTALVNFAESGTASSFAADMAVVMEKKGTCTDMLARLQ